MSTEAAVQNLAQIADDRNADITEAEIREDIETLLEYRLGLEEAVRTVRDNNNLYEASS